MKSLLVAGLGSAAHERIKKYDSLPTCDIPIANGWQANLRIHRNAQTDYYIVNLEIEHIE